MDARQHQGFYGENFVRALVAAAGLQIGKMEPDISGEDLTIGYAGQLGGMKHPRIDAQVKTWSQPRGSSTAWKFRGLTEAQFNNLIDPRFPRFLFLILVPPDRQEYAEATVDALHLRQAGYWVSLASHRPIENPSAKRPVTVEVPKDNLLSVKNLHGLLASMEAEA